MQFNILKSIISIETVFPDGLYRQLFSLAFLVLENFVMTCSVFFSHSMLHVVQWGLANFGLIINKPYTIIVITLLQKHFV